MFKIQLYRIELIKQMAAWNKTVQISIATAQIIIATVSILPNLPQEQCKYLEVKPGDKE
jgi:hypothetical protein